MKNAQLLLGQTLSFQGDPFQMPIKDACTFRRHGAVLIEDGIITATGEADQLRR